ncbi:hypothetical protein MYX84_15240 [Acidobacteria bacterium AH-259-O06]|nr:hypothetical protein [Acidobacteria bacterium AH-259-O06]
MGEPNVAIPLDAYHMNIEENDFYNPSRKAAPILSLPPERKPPRGLPGRGLDWEATYRPLAESGYRDLVLCRDVGSHAVRHLHLASS